MRKVCALLAGFVLLAFPALAADGEYLFDVLKKPAYKQAWTAMMASGKPPAWLTTFTRGGNGVSSPGEALTIEGQRYEFGNVCKPHDCGDNMFHVIFMPGGGRAWGVLMENGALRYFGNPSPAQRAALEKSTGN